MLLVWLLCAVAALAENVDPYGGSEQYGCSENTGWLNAEPSSGGGMQVEANPLTGWVWGENIGWIHFDQTERWAMRVCIVTLEDLANFAADWLAVSGAPGANLDGIGSVNMADLKLFSKEWLDYCPDGWQLK